jgi:hypothetical protein
VFRGARLRTAPRANAVPPAVSIRLERAMSKKPRNLLVYFTENLITVVGIVLIWRGVWYLLDWVDKTFFAGNYVFTSIAGIIIGLLILYLPDKSLKEIERI